MRTGGFLCLILAVALSAGCGSRAPRPAPAQQAQANDVLFRAIGLVGTPYRWGGNTPESGFDCSGLVGYVFRESAQLNLPRTTAGLATMKAPDVRPARLQPADLVFFGGRKVTHIGIYVGEGRFVHAPSSGGTVRLDHLDAPYWKEHYRFARRVLD